MDRKELRDRPQVSRKWEKDGKRRIKCHPKTAPKHGAIAPDEGDVIDAKITPDSGFVLPVRFEVTGLGDAWNDGKEQWAYGEVDWAPAIQELREQIDGDTLTDEEADVIRDRTGYLTDEETQMLIDALTEGEDEGEEKLRGPDNALYSHDDMPAVGDVVEVPEAPMMLQKRERRAYELTVIDVDRQPVRECDLPRTDGHEGAMHADSTKELDARISATYKGKGGNEYAFEAWESHLPWGRRERAAQELRKAAEADRPKRHLQKARKLMDWTIAEMGEELGLAVQKTDDGWGQCRTLAAWLGGTRTPGWESRKKMKALADKLEE